MNLNKLFIYPLIFFVSLVIGCSKDNLVQPVTTSETVDCGILSPDYDAPLNLNVRSVNSDHLELTWNFVRLPSNYKIYKNNVLLGSTNGDSYFDYFSVAPETKYTYYVYSEATAKKSRQSTTIIHTGYLSETNPQDNYSVTLDSDCLLNLYLTKDDNLELTGFFLPIEIYNSNGTLVGNGPTALKAGTYNVRVTRSSGKGNIKLTCYVLENLYANDSEPNGLKENSILVQPNSIVKGHLGYNGNAINSPDLTDYYRIDIPANKFYALTIDRSSDLRLGYVFDLEISILKNDGLTSVSEFNTIGANSVTKQLSLSTGTYYIKVTRSSGFGGYEFKMCPGN